MKKIVVGVDGSHEAATALRWAYDEAVLRGAELHVVHAWVFPYPGYRSGVYEPYGDMKLEAAKVLEEVVSAFRAEVGDGHPVFTHLVEETPVAALMAESKDAEMLVVGSRGRGGFASLLLGSTSHQVASHAVCPVVIIRPPEG